MANRIKLTPERKAKFLAELEKLPNVARACRRVGVSAVCAYEHRKNDEEFREAWDEAIQVSVAELEESMFERGKATDTVAGIFMLKAHGGDKYKETRRNEITGANGGPVQCAVTVYVPDNGRGKK